MSLIAPARRLTTLLLLAGGMAFAQSTLPATSPTTAPATPVVATPVSTPTPKTGHRAIIIYAQGQLQIVADNSSLNQILRDISTQTGMKIIGGVTDQRVFGQYGPGPPARILASLLDGTGTNMLLRETSTKVPTELILTAQQGGPTPPNPNAPGFDDDSAISEPPNPPPPTPQFNPAVQPTPPRPAYSTFSGGTSATPPTPSGAGTTSNAPSTGAANPTSPNGVLTPQQIYQQLQQLQHAQPQQ